MGYYRGDYYRGDYYRGDNFFRKIGKAVGKVAGTVVGFATGGIGGAIAGHSAGGHVGTALTTPVKHHQIPAGITITGAIPNIGGISVSPGAVMPGGAPLIQTFGPNMMGPQAGGGECPKGYHLDKATRSRCVRNRSMNVCNVKALRRGLRRAEGFEKIARRTVVGLRSGPKKFKAKGRKR